MATELSDGALIFEDRSDAGNILAKELLRYRNANPIILALPRGGVVVGYEIARRLHAPLDVIVARKVGAPGNEELGIGAIAPEGVQVLDESVIHLLGITKERLQRIIARENEEMNRRLRLYRGDRPLPDVRNRTAIMVDDGMATGVTARAAVVWLRRHEPQRLVVAMPVCARETADQMRAEVDELICVTTPYQFRAVGLWYRRFEQTTDQEVIALLARAAQETKATV
jgi:putative phosphoribosyl transferase